MIEEALTEATRVLRDQNDKIEVWTRTHSRISDPALEGSLSRSSQSFVPIAPISLQEPQDSAGALLDGIPSGSSDPDSYERCEPASCLTTGADLGNGTHLGRGCGVKWDHDTERYDFDWPERVDRPRVFNGRFA